MKPVKIISINRKRRFIVKIRNPITGARLKNEFIYAQVISIFLHDTCDVNGFFLRNII